MCNLGINTQKKMPNQKIAERVRTPREFMFKFLEKISAMVTIFYLISILQIQILSVCLWVIGSGPFLFGFFCEGVSLYYCSVEISDVDF